ncbi:hypothetical protein ABEG10_29020 [Burkholderia cenocepacia]|uniref:hypothetical protein n=1 Tax=Burkholderia cenocepacia TaxID=95486 RepID=UPI00114CE302|nr:hypothetical protein [Burkholderia cenocepacia]MCO8324577.1 hypothetical protein [Burkholderia cenocepacia]MCO8331647.1 hypothetical protein [Burkholderia cenocepacia]MCO8339147.1 hypothetical protein [Burkholderia cenocepacia]MCO8346433.1 hypothetical protein [Burkholderia cenocepacia]MCO8359500.1 hypothetical protein [Burkholderia cenocepacia]
MLQTVKKGSSLHVVGRSTARIGEAARFGAPGDTRERPSCKARRGMVAVGKYGRRRPASGRAIGKRCVGGPPTRTRAGDPAGLAGSRRRPATAMTAAARADADQQ